MACRVYGNVSNVFTGAQSGVTITIEFTQANEYSNATTGVYLSLLPASTSVTSGANGEWEISVLDNENMVRPGFYKFTFVYGDYTKVWEKYVPDATEAEFTTLVNVG